jgi:hemin uptake protein HemP
MFTTRFSVVTTPDPTPSDPDPSPDPRSLRRSADSSSGGPTRRVWRSDDLFGDENEVLIMHGDLVYRLRRTRNGKLILHK